MADLIDDLLNLLMVTREEMDREAINFSAKFSFSVGEVIP
jgi:hypothetical protein